jgi:hypothetical protein
VGDFYGSGNADLAVVPSYTVGSNTVGDWVTVLLSHLTETATATAPGISPVGTGTHLVEASYPGDSIYNPSTSGTTGLTAQQVTPTVTVTPSSSSITTAQTLTVTVAVNGGSGNPTPTGSVTLSSGGYASAATSLNNGGATINIPAGSLATGTDKLTASYSGDSNYTASTGTTSVTVTVPPPSFTVSGTAVNVLPGATSGNTSTITVTPAGGFTGSVTLTASLASNPNGAVKLPTLSFGSTSPVSITSASAATATLTIFTTAPSTNGCTAFNRTPRGIPWYAGGSTVLACVLLFGVPARRRRWLSLLGMMMLVVGLTGGVLACGGASGGGGCSPVTYPGTTAGAYTITVTGTSGATTATGTVTLTVQ